MRLNGWQCIGIILSALWAIGGGLWENSSIVTRHNEFYNLSFKICDEIKSSSLNPEMQSNDCDAHAERVAAPLGEHQLANVLFFALTPIPVAWGIVYLTVLLVRRIRAGFAAL
jgi:hypothetical protein